MDTRFITIAGQNCEFKRLSEAFIVRTAHRLSSLTLSPKPDGAVDINTLNAVEAALGFMVDIILEGIHVPGKARREKMAWIESLSVNDILNASSAIIQHNIAVSRKASFLPTSRIPKPMRNIKTLELTAILTLVGTFQAAFSADLKDPKSS